MANIGWILIVMGTSLMAISSVLLLLQETFLKKLHYASLGDGIGMTLVLVGATLIMHDKLKGLLLIALFLIVSPMTTHIIGRAFFIRSE